MTSSPVIVREEIWYVMSLISMANVPLHDIEQNDTYQYLSQHCEEREIAIPKHVVLNNELEEYIQSTAVCDLDIRTVNGEECVVFVDLNNMFHKLTNMYEKVLSIINFENFVEWRYNLCRSSIYRMNIVIDQMELIEHLEAEL